MQGLGTIIYLVTLFAIIYFLMIRPQQLQQKKRREMLGRLKVNDRVVTLGGLHGKVTKLNDDTMTLKIAPNVEVEFLKSAVGYIQDEK